jgi:hypothetical protein
MFATTRYQHPAGRRERNRVAILAAFGIALVLVILALGALTLIEPHGTGPLPEPAPLAAPPIVALLS